MFCCTDKRPFPVTFDILMVSSPSWPSSSCLVDWPCSQPDFFLVPFDLDECVIGIVGDESSC